MLEAITKYTEVIECVFTLSLILLTIVSVAIALWSYQRIKEQILLQRWASLVAIVYAAKERRLQLILKSKAIKDEQLGRDYDKVIVEMEGEMSRLEGIIRNMEARLRFP